jgi:STE24 endopeptidase
VVQSNLLFNFIVFAIFIHNKALFASFGFDSRLATASPAGGPQPIMIGFVLYQLVLSPLDTLVTFLLNSLTRKYEYQAGQSARFTLVRGTKLNCLDEFAIKMDKKDDLAKALIKLHIDNLSSPHNDKLYSMYHHSHPTLPERLRAMDVFEKKWQATGGAKSAAKKEL